jgi:hypothetical protein
MTGRFIFLIRFTANPRVRFHHDFDLDYDAYLDFGFISEYGFLRSFKFVLNTRLTSLKITFKSCESRIDPNLHHHFPFPRKLLHQVICFPYRRLNTMFVSRASQNGDWDAAERARNYKEIRIGLRLCYATWLECSWGESTSTELVLQIYCNYGRLRIISLRQESRIGKRVMDLLWKMKHGHGNLEEWIPKQFNRFHSSSATDVRPANNQRTIRGIYVHG